MLLFQLFSFHFNINIWSNLCYVLPEIFNSRIMYHRWRGIYISQWSAYFLFSWSLSNNVLSTSEVIGLFMIKLNHLSHQSDTGVTLKAASILYRQPCLKAEIQNCLYDLNPSASIRFFLDNMWKTYSLILFHKLTIRFRCFSLNRGCWNSVTMAGFFPFLKRKDERKEKMIMKTNEEMYC